jgi:hypothetical protein
VVCSHTLTGLDSRTFYQIPSRNEASTWNKKLAATLAATSSFLRKKSKSFIKRGVFNHLASVSLAVTLPSKAVVAAVAAMEAVAAAVMAVLNALCMMQCALVAVCRPKFPLSPAAINPFFAATVISGTTTDALLRIKQEESSMAKNNQKREKALRNK